MDILSKFNENQIKAIKSPLGTSLVVAGAGSGKTAVLSCRISYLISEYGLSPKRILAFTFTNKASNEMKNRVQNILGDITPYWINTFHSFCLRVLREDINSIGREKNFTIIDEDDQMQILRTIYAEFGIDKTILSNKLCLKYINDIKSMYSDSNESILDYLENLEVDYNNLQKKSIIEKVYFEYQNYLDKNNILDFNDLIKYVNKIFSNNIEVLEKWQSRFDYVLVDEFQDTNKEQFEIIKFLCKDKTNIFVVGDPDQMIYTWRGAYSEIFKEFNEYFVDSQIYILDKNYRSTKKILGISNQLISQNAKRVEKNLYTDNEEGSNIIYFHANNQDRESRWIVEKIQFLLSKNYKYNDIAILYRSNFLSRNIEQELIRNNIPYFIYGGFKFYQRKEIKDVVAYLKLICNNDDLSFTRICNVPKRKISEQTIALLRKFSFEKKISLYDSLEYIDNIKINSQAINACKEFKKIIDDFKSKKFNSLLNLLDYVLEKTNYLKWLEEEEEKFRIENILELKNAISQFELKNPNCSLNDYLQEISLYTSLDEDNFKNKNFVSLMTIHLAKGLEFKNIFIIEFNDGIFPSTKSIESNKIDEERRLAYVAMTRAKENLFISSSEGTTFQSEISSNKIPSRFLKEIENYSHFEKIFDSYKPLYNLDSKKNWYNSNKAYDSFKDIYHEEEKNFSIGDVIVHTKFGDGVVLSVDKSILEISFKFPHGVKNIMKNHKSIIRKLS